MPAKTTAKPAPSPARSFYIMNRTGLFRPSHTTPNQCKEPGWPEYAYALRMVFPGDMKLNHNDFIVDHAEVDKLVKGLTNVGSCEDITRAILTALDQFMASRKLPMLACRCTVRATDPNAPAWLERIHVHPTAPADALRLLQ
jgi:hypothetical protein